MTGGAELDAAPEGSSTRKVDGWRSLAEKAAKILDLAA
jgi:hypothetical protein